MREHRLEFTASENPWAPTAVVAEINRRTGSGLELVGLAEQTGGTSSAAFVRWPDGRDGALTRTMTPLDRMRQTADVLALARSRGLPVPRHDLVLELADGMTAVVQERLPGRHARRVGASAVDALVTMNDRFAGLLVGRPDVPPPPAFPAPGPDGHPWERTLGRHSDRTRLLLQRLREIDDGDDGHAMAGDDLVHTDYSFGNILFDGRGRVSGVVDWNFGVARGDRRFALLGARTHLAVEGDQYAGLQAAIERLDAILDATIEPPLLRRYWAHWSAYDVHRSIRLNFPAERIEHDLRRAGSHLI